MSENKRSILILIGAILLFLLVALLFPPRAPSQEARPQILLVYNHTDVNGKYVVLVKAQPILLLRQADPNVHLAPIERNTLMLCRPYVEDSHLMFRCGQDKFVMDAISFEPEK